MGEHAAPYSLLIWDAPHQKPTIVTPDAKNVELEAADDRQAYKLALEAIKMIGFKLGTGMLVRNGPEPLMRHHMMFYQPKKGWYFGDDRDLAVP